MHLDDFAYDLPRELIADRPAEPRDAARLLVLPAEGGLLDRRIADLPELLRPGDLLVFFCGLEGWDHPAAPALYLLGYFEVAVAGRARDFTERERRELFGENFHVRHECIYRQQEDRLVLVKGSPDSRLFERAVAISEPGWTRTGKPLKVLSREMQAIFGGFDGRLSFQRSPTRWVDPAFVDRAAAFVRSLR